MKKYILFFNVILFLMSCNKSERMESPLMTVIKLNSAESLGNFDEAENYLDVNQTYSKHIREGISANEAWKEYVRFTYNLGQDNKFTSTFKYYNYNIKESQSGNSSKVIFEALNPKSKIREIIYHLKSVDGKWKVIDIEYVK